MRDDIILLKQVLVDFGYFTVISTKIIKSIEVVRLKFFSSANLL